MVDAAEVEDAIAATNEGASRYARALQKGLGYLLAAGEVWRREIDAGEARRRFDVGVPERSLTFVPATAPA